MLTRRELPRLRAPIVRLLQNAIDRFINTLRRDRTPHIDGLIHEGVRPKSTITREIAANDVAAVFIRYGIDIIAERIEDEAAVVEILELEIPYAQGHLFGAPRAIKESLMEETAPPPGMFGRERGAA